MSLKYRREDLRRAGMEPICPECGARGDEDHDRGCRISTYLARVNLWKEAT